MSDSDSDNPAEIYEAANTATLNLLPEKSRKIYLKQYEIFMEWCNIHKIKKLKEEVPTSRIFSGKGQGFKIINIMVRILDVKINNYGQK